jgi:transposase
VRRRVQRETLGHRGRNDDPLYGIRRLLTRGYERLSDRQRARVDEALRRGDPYDEVGGAWAVKEQLRWVYDADGPTEARKRLDHFYELARTAGTPEVLRLSKTIKRWETEVLSFFTTGRTNARSEAMNLVTEKLRRNAHGIRNFEHYRLRLLLHSGVQWHTRPTARIRGRHPRLVA